MAAYTVIDGASRNWSEWLDLIMAGTRDPTPGGGITDYTVRGWNYGRVYMLVYDE